MNELFEKYTTLITAFANGTSLPLSYHR